MVKRASTRLLALVGISPSWGSAGRCRCSSAAAAGEHLSAGARVDSGLDRRRGQRHRHAFNAVVTVLVGSQQPGRIRELFADFNSQVRAGDVIARLDDDQVQARLLQARADLDWRAPSSWRAGRSRHCARECRQPARAEIRADAQSREADRDNLRRRELAQRGAASTADAERAQSAMDAARAGAGWPHARGRPRRRRASRHRRRSSGAAEAAVAQREAMVRQMEVEVAQHTILSPIDGVVIQRNIDLGQTVAASLQRPRCSRSRRICARWRWPTKATSAASSSASRSSSRVSAFRGELPRRRSRSACRRRSPQNVVYATSW